VEKKEYNMNGSRVQITHTFICLAKWSGMYCNLCFEVFVNHVHCGYRLLFWHPFHSKQVANALTTAHRCEILSGQGHIMLQMAPYMKRQPCFEECKSHCNTISAFTSSNSHWIFQYIQICILDWLLALCIRNTAKV
jgi:hypothetical protein